MTEPVRLLVEVVPSSSPWDRETPEELVSTIEAAINKCHVHGTTNPAIVTLL